MSTCIKVDPGYLIGTEKMHARGERVAIVQVVEAYVNLVDCIAAYRDQGATHRSDDEQDREAAIH